MKQNRFTTIWEKTAPSLINVMVVFLFCMPILWLSFDLFLKKICIVVLFFFYNLLFVLVNSGRCLGMMLIGTWWAHDYPLAQHLIFITFYTMSFASLLFWVYVPFDIFIVNMLCLQIPSIFITRATFHGFLSGGMRTVKVS